MIAYRVSSFLRANFVPLGEEIPFKLGRQTGLEYPLRNHYFTAISSSSVRTVADRHRLAAYHNSMVLVSNCPASYGLSVLVN